MILFEWNISMQMGCLKKFLDKKVAVSEQEKQSNESYYTNYISL